MISFETSGSINDPFAD